MQKKHRENRPGAPRADTASAPQRYWRRRRQRGAPRSDLLAARVPQQSRARGTALPSAPQSLRPSLAPAPGVAAPAGGASERAEPPGGGDEVTARRPSHLPLLARDAPPGKGRRKVIGVQGARGGTWLLPRIAVLSTRSKIEALPAHVRSSKQRSPRLTPDKPLPARLRPPGVGYFPSYVTLGESPHCVGSLLRIHQNQTPFLESLRHAGSFTKQFHT